MHADVNLSPVTSFKKKRETKQCVIDYEGQNEKNV